MQATALVAAELVVGALPDPNAGRLAGTAKPDPEALALERSPPKAVGMLKDGICGKAAAIAGAENNREWRNEGMVKKERSADVIFIVLVTMSWMKNASRLFHGAEYIPFRLRSKKFLFILEISGSRLCLGHQVFKFAPQTMSGGDVTFAAATSSQQQDGMVKFDQEDTNVGYASFIRQRGAYPPASELHKVGNPCH